MPTYDVKIRFRGLCPFVPGADLEAGEKPAWVGSFLVNASRLKLKESDGSDLPEHLPYLRFKTSDLLGNEKAPETPVLLRLDFEDIVFLPSAGTQKQLNVNFAIPDPPGPRPANTQEERLINWVTRMDDVMAGSGKVDRDCFEIHPRKSRIVARVHIDHGALETENLGKVDSHVVVSRLQAGSRQQATARTVSLTMPCETGGSFRIKTRSFRAPNNPAQPVHGPAPAPRELVFRDPGAGKSLELEVVNLCVDDLLLRQGATVEDAFRPDSDFRAIYLLSSGVTSLAGRAVPLPLTPAPGELRTIRANIKKKGGGGSDGSQCSPPRTSAAPQEAVTAMQATITEIEQG